MNPLAILAGGFLLVVAITATALLQPVQPTDHPDKQMANIMLLFIAGLAGISGLILSTAGLLF